MPEQFEDLLALFGGPKDPTPPVDPVVVPPEPPVDEEEEPEEETPVTEEEPEEENPTIEIPEPIVPPVPEDKAGRAFAEMRVQKTAYERALKAGAEAAGLPLDEFIKNMETAGLSKRAKEIGTSPEIMARLEELEAEKQARDNESVQRHLQTQFETIKTAVPGVGNKELQAFTAALVARGHDFQNLNANYEELYRGMYYKEVREKERQAALAARRNGSPSVPPPQNGRGTANTVTEVKNLADLNSLLDQMPK